VSKLAVRYFCSVSVLRHLRADPARAIIALLRARVRVLDRLSQVFRCCIAAAFSLTFFSACAPTTVQMEPLKSTQALQYYPFQVKGYQNTYPKRRVMVLAAVDARDFKDTSGAAHSPENGNPAIGVIRDKSGEIVQRLYGPALEPLVQQSIAQAAQEAGMISSASNIPLKNALSLRQAQYLIAAKIARFWVDKHGGPANAAGPTWSATAEVALDVVVYKAPFEVPFWQGESDATYDDPPAPVAGMSPEDETEIYDDPGQDLSVGLTRAVAGIFQRDDLHTLITEDSPLTHQ
jgi:hypothetical protein